MEKDDNEKMRRVQNLELTEKEKMLNSTLEKCMLFCKLETEIDYGNFNNMVMPIVVGRNYYNEKLEFVFAINKKLGIWDFKIVTLDANQIIKIIPSLDKVPEFIQGEIMNSLSTELREEIKRKAQDFVPTWNTLFYPIRFR